MISFLRGKILNKGQSYIIILVQDIGYKVFVNSKMYSEVDINKEIEVYIHQHVREDALDLYGFNLLEDLEMFELLLSISGVGPKSALAVLAIASVGEIKESIAHGDSDLLIKVSGIGKKTAERVVLELHEKVGALNISSDSGLSINSDEIDALVALGYSLMQARDALKQVDSDIKDSGERIKLALKQLGK